ncbi:hypothetical protein J5N97_018156 [Dioscorea zingiberensis]|uniref:Uncharacterized protein n=1 Tax=Dioscorea zingiberensis TaxID=325984 RepID=A0A9D5CMN0_9LILI|nr:hypothetical protein J5N97_018156 [Dioscorea zingiberensis]
MAPPGPTPPLKAPPGQERRQNTGPSGANINPARSWSKVVRDQRNEIPNVIFPGPILEKLKTTITDSITIDPEMLARAHMSMSDGHTAAPMDTGNPNPIPVEENLQHTDNTTRPPLDKLGYGSWMTEQRYQIQRGSRGRGRGRGRGTGRGSGPGRGDGHPTATTQVAVEGHVIPQIPDALTGPDHVPSSFPVITSIPDHVQEQEVAPPPSDVRRVDSPPRGRPVGRFSRGSLSRDVGDDRLISFVKERTSRERSTDGLHSGRDRSRSLNRNEGRQDGHRPGHELASGSKLRANPGTRGGNLMITSLADDDDPDPRPANHNRRSKDKALALDPNSSSHLGLVRRLSQALEREKPEQLSDEESIEEDDPPDRGRRMVEDRSNNKEQSNTSPMEARYPTDDGQGSSRPLPPFDKGCS